MDEKDPFDFLDKIANENGTFSFKQLDIPFKNYKAQLSVLVGFEKEEDYNWKLFESK